MKDLLRKCYQEAGIINANATLYESRTTAIQQILDNKDFFEKENWILLMKWAIGAVKTEAAEELLVDLEEAFCQTDDGYTNENQKELHILVEMLLFQYCKQSENLLLASIVICGYGVGWRMTSRVLYRMFLAYTNEARLALRQQNQHKLTGMATLQTTKAQEAAVTDKDRIAQITNDLAKIEKQLYVLTQKSQELDLALSVQREESDILWWMLAEWSETCGRSYRDMSKEEAALFSAYELSHNSSFPLGPYASKQILMKMISLGKTSGQETASVAALIDRLDNELPLSFAECQITEIQPILSALDAKRKAVQKGKSSGWRSYYELNCEKDLDSLSLTAFDFGRQLYLEIELGQQLFAESNGE